MAPCSRAEHFQCETQPKAQGQCQNKAKERSWGLITKGETGVPSTQRERERELQCIHTDFNFCIHDSDPYGDVYFINKFITNTK